MTNCTRTMTIKHSIFLWVALLSACAGGGGSSSTTTTTTDSTTYTKLLSATANTSTSYSAYSLEDTSVTLNSSGVVTTDAPSTPALKSDGSLAVAYNSSGVLNQLTITANATTTFSTTSSATFGVQVGSVDSHVAAVYNSNVLSSATAIAIYPVIKDMTTAWEYQTFGAWETGRTTTSATVGAASVGSATSYAGIPTTGTGTYSGVSGGVYVDSSGGVNFTKSTVTLTTDYANKSIAFVTASTSSVNTTKGLSATAITRTNLDLTGTLSWSSSNSFSGTVANASGTSLSGNAYGRFYGPAAVEAGGVFSVKTASGVERYIGAFGATSK